MDMLINMTAFMMPLMLFLFWGVLGLATLSLLRSQRSTMQNIFLAPVAGMVVTLLPVFWLNRIGIPIKSFSFLLSFLLLMAGFTIIYFRKPIFPFKKILPFIAIFLLAYILMARPLLMLGFNWVSYTNDDMINYGLGALRFLNFGYSDLPNYADLFRGRDYSLYYWFMHVSGMSRSGSELLIAWLSSISHLETIQVFMPLIIAFHLSLISVVAAMALRSSRYYKIALVTCLLVAVSPLTALGTFYQLIAQVSGLALLIATCVLLFHTFSKHMRYMVLRQSILLAIFVSGLLIQYPEVSPMMGIGYLVFFVVSILSGWRTSASYWKIVGLSLALSLVFLNSYWINFFAFLQLQLHSGFSTENTILFPYFLLPSGIANLWGFQPIAILAREPWLSVSILIGMILSLLTIYFSCRLLARRSIPAIMTLVMIGLGLLLFKQNSGFGLFKLAMYIQPFLITVLVLGAAMFLKNIKARRYGLVSLLALWVITQHYYYKSSYGVLGLPYNELPMASQTQVLTEVGLIKQQLATTNVPVMLDTPSVVSAKLLASYLPDKDLGFYSNQFFLLSLKRFFTVSRDILEYYSKNLYDTTIALRERIIGSSPKQTFSFEDIYRKPYAASFFAPSILPDSKSKIIMECSLRSIFNRRDYPECHNQNYILKDLHEVDNHLVFVSSSLGQHYYFGETPLVSVNNLEKDYFYPDSSMAMIGRFLLFQVINPSKKIRLEINITDSLNSDQNNRLPKPSIIGNNLSPVGLVGRGSAHVFSEAFEPRLIGNQYYFMLDMGEKGKVFPSQHKGLMSLYGRNIGLDNRLLVAFARNISIIADENYKLNPPIKVDTFPKDLANTDLEYSGIYEDGWLSENAFIDLLQPEKNSQLLVKLKLPQDKKKTITNLVTVMVDGKPVSKNVIYAGETTTTIRVPVSDKNKIHRINFQFSESFNLPQSDGRPVSAKIIYLGFNS